VTGSDWGGSTRRGLFWSAASLLGNRAVNFLSLLALAWLLTPGEFGVAAAVFVFLSFIELGSDLGMKATVVYEQEEGVTARVQSAFTLNLLIAIALCGLAVLAAPLVAGFFRMEDHVGLFRLGALSLLLTGLGNIHDSLLLRGMDFKRRTLPQLSRAVVRAAVSIVLAATGSGAEALVIGLLAGSAAWTVVQWVVSPFRPTFELDLGVVRSMAGYGSAAALLEVLAVTNNRADAAVIGRVLSERALGLYTIAFRVPELVIETVAWNTSQVAFPALSRKRVSDRADLARATLRIVRFQALYALPVAAGLALVATPLLSVMLPSEWESAGGVMAAIAVMTGISAVVFPLGDVFKALGRQRVLVALNLVQLPLLVGSIVAAAPAGIVAVAWARAGAKAVFAVALIAFVLKAIGSDVRSLGRATAPALIGALGVLIAAGAVRLAWDDGPDLALLLATTAAGAAGGLIAVRLFAFDALRELWSQLVAMRSKRGDALRSGA
jgi:lipopolysaccharide exporter